MITLNVAINEIDKIIDEIDDEIKQSGLTMTRSEVIAEDDINALLDSLRDALTPDKYAEAERYLRLKIGS